MLSIVQRQKKVPVSFIFERHNPWDLSVLPLFVQPAMFVFILKTSLCTKVSGQNSAKWLIRSMLITKQGTVHLPDLKRNQSSYFAGLQWDHLKGFCISAEARKWSQYRNVLLVSHAAVFRNYTVIFRAHAYMGTVQQNLCTFYCKW